MITKRLADQDKSNSGSQRDLSVSYDRVGNVLLAQGKLQDALDLYQQGLAIAKRLAEQDNPTQNGRTMPLGADIALQKF